MDIQKITSRIDKTWSMGLHPVLLLLRLITGFGLFFAGKGKLFNIDQTAEFFTSLDIPMPYINAIMAGSTEMIGGALLILGLGTRLISIPLTITMLVALSTAHADELSGIFSTEGHFGFVAAAPTPYLLALLGILIAGPGRLMGAAL